MIQIEGPDGNIYEYPEGTSDEFILGEMKRMFGGPDAATKPDASPLSTIEQRAAMAARIAAAKGGTLTVPPVRAERQAEIDAMVLAGMPPPASKDSAFGAFASNLGQGVSLGFADEIAARIGSAFEDRSYDEILSGLRKQDRSLEEQFPKSSFAGELTGAVAMPLGAFKTTGRLGLDALRGAATGGGLGLLLGFGTGEGGIENRAASAVVPGLLGAAGGGLAPVIAKGFGNFMGMFKRSDVSKIAKDLGISKDAAKVIKTVFDQGGDITAARAALIRAGDEGMLADAGYAAQALLDGAAAAGGKPGQIVREAIDTRMERTSASLDDVMNTTLGPAPMGPMTALDDIAKKSAPARKDAYAAAYSAPINYAEAPGMMIEDVISRIDPKITIEAVNRANAKMTWAGVKNGQIMAKIGANGEIVFLEMPNVQQLDELKRALDGMAYAPANINPTTGKLTPDGQFLNEQARALKKAIADAVPEYDVAVSLGGDKLAEERAFMLGRDLLRTNTELEDVLLELGPKPSIDQIAAAKSGLRDFVRKTLGDVKAVASDPDIDARQVIKAVSDLSSDNARAKIVQLLGPEAGPLLAEIDKAAQSSLVRAAVAANSKTAARTAVGKTVEEVTAPGVLGKALAGEPVNTAQSAIQALTGQTSEFTAMQKQKIFADIAKALTEKKGASARAALDYMEKAMNGQALTEAQTAFVVQQVEGALMRGGVVALPPAYERSRAQ